MGAITGTPSQADITAMLEAYALVGVEQFLIYPRAGCELAYMSEAWLDCCAMIIATAARLHMRIWLYDEFFCPSGGCGGQVIKADRNFGGKKLAAFKNCRGTYDWAVFSSSKYPDVLNPDAVDCFIKLTHAKYAERFSRYFGAVIKGIFTDEPSMVYALYNKNDGAALELPYYDGLELDYRAAAGRDFRPDVEKYLEGAAPEGLGETYHKIMGTRLRRVYFDKIRTWCDRHNLLFTGHLMDESDPIHAVLSNGNPMLVSEGLSLPGIDEIFTRSTPESIEWITLKTAERATAAKGVGGMAELFALGPPDMPLARIRQMIWLTALHGIDRYLLAIAPLDARGNKDKPNYYNPFTRTQPWFDALREIGTDARKAAGIARKKSGGAIAVRWPQSLTAARFMFTRPETSKTPPLRDLLEALVQAQYQVKLVAEEESCAACRIVLAAGTEGIAEEKSGETFADIPGLMRWLAGHAQRESVVENADGSPARYLLVKTFCDGCVCVLSLADVERRLVLQRPGAMPLPFVLPGRGVFLSDDAAAEADAARETFDVSALELELSLMSPNTMRCVFGADGICRFELADGRDDIVIVARSYGGEARVALDGVEVMTATPCGALPQGLRELYRASRKITLAPGAHILKLGSPAQDYPYLPSAFIAGNFGLFGKNTLGRLPPRASLRGLSAAGLANYAGRIVLTGTIAIPPAGSLTMNTRGLCTEALLNGESLGRRAWAPFRWEVPGHCQGHDAGITINMDTSVGPLFGDYPHRAGAASKNSWLFAYAPGNYAV